jgi:N-acyl-D-aspartate/D-glutamate deacylase
VHKLTGEPASVYGIRDRGRIAAGCWADLLLFDPKTVDRGPKERVHDLPGGGARLTTPAVGVHGVWVNGSRLVDERGAVMSAAAVKGAADTGSLPGPDLGHPPDQVFVVYLRAFNLNGLARAHHEISIPHHHH